MSILSGVKKIKRLSKNKVKIEIFFFEFFMIIYVHTKLF